MKVKVDSAGFEGGNFAKIRVNGVRILVNKNESNHCRGLHLVIIDPKTG